MPLRLPTGKDVVYRRAATADASGRFELTVPYPTERTPDSDVTPRGGYELSAGGVSVGRATVRAADVEAGARVAVAP